MIVIAYKPGQLANRLFHFSKFLAYGLRHKVLVINPAFDDYAHYFASTAKQWLPASRGFSGNASASIIQVIYRLSFIIGRVLHRLGIRLSALSTLYLDWSEGYDLDGDERLERSGIHFIQGWQFNAPDLLSAYRTELIDFFKPEARLLVRINAVIDTSFQAGIIMVGVHIRHGDYRSFEGGKYFYELGAYRTVMEGLSNKHRDIRFLICTNNMEITPADFPQLDVVVAPGHELVDLYTLANCHYIMGPPSTYSLWASFYGNVPLYQIEDISREISLADFRSYETF